MSNFNTAIVDADFIKYMAAACGEKRSIIVTNIHTGEEYTFKTRTEFYGRGKGKNGGWLAEYNLAKNLELAYTDFTIRDVQTKLDFSNCTNVVDYQIRQGLAGIGTNRYKAFVGRGDSFRVERSTLLKYKGQRTNLLKPLYLTDVEEYLIDKGVDVDNKNNLYNLSNNPLIFLCSSAKNYGYKNYHLHVRGLEKVNIRTV
jgi:hypothetical protein